MAHARGRCASWLGTAALLVLLARSASALTLTPLEDGRNVYDEFICPTLPCSSVAVPDSPFAPFSASLAGGQAGQNSTVDPFSMGGSGGADSDHPVLLSASNFDVTFSIDAPAIYQLFGTVGAGATNEHTPTGRYSAAGVSLWDEAGVSPLQNVSVGSSLGGSGQSFNRVAIVPPGIYTMRAYASSADVSAGWTFTLSLFPVPEPSVGPLLGAGLLGLGLHRAHG